MKEYLNIFKKDIENFIEDLINLKVVSIDKDKAYWLANYKVEDYFIQYYICDKEISIEDCYEENKNPLRFEDKQDLIDCLQEMIIQTIKWNLIEHYAEVISI